MKTNMHKPPNPYQNPKPISVALGACVGVALIGSAFASFRAPRSAKPTHAQRQTHCLPQEWVWQRRAVNFDDMYRRKPVDMPRRHRRAANPDAA